MKVDLLSYTPGALELLLYTKDTRLRGGTTLDDIKAWPEQQKMEHLAYMLDTIQSSWEFCDYVFEISGVTRAFTHQLVRTRVGSYAQESQRTVDVRDASVIMPESIASNPNHKREWKETVDIILTDYATFIDDGVPVQDARGLLPTNMTTSIIAKFNLRTLHDMAEKRLCTRTQGEYQDVFRAMRARVLEVHPWAEPFIQVYCVNHGICCFPRYKECPIQQYTFRGEGLGAVKMRVKLEFESIRHEAVPIAKGGRTM